MAYSTERRAAVLKRMRAPNAVALRQLAREEGMGSAQPPAATRSAASMARMAALHLRRSEHRGIVYPGREARALMAAVPHLARTSGWPAHTARTRRRRQKSETAHHITADNFFDNQGGMANICIEICRNETLRAFFEADDERATQASLLAASNEFFERRKQIAHSLNSKNSASPKNIPCDICKFVALAGDLGRTLEVKIAGKQPARP